MLKAIKRDLCKTYAFAQIPFYNTETFLKIRYQYCVCVVLPVTGVKTLKYRKTCGRKLLTAGLVNHRGFEPRTL